MTEEWLQMIDDCEARDEYLTAWEADFLASIREQIGASAFLSEKQQDVLDRIWEKVTSKG
jgi:hypothetical protein